VRIGAVIHDGVYVRPDGDVKIRAHDRVIIFALAEYVRKVEQMFRVSLDFF
jgi:trk system potassium uptake protein TrkA